MTTYAEATTVKTTKQIVAELLAAMAALGVDISGFGDLSVQRAIPELQAGAEQKLQELRSTLVRAGIPTLSAEAGSDWVDVTLYGFFQEIRIPATKAQWLLTLTCAAGAGPYTLAKGDLIAQDEAGITYSNLNPIRIASGGTASPPPLFECRVAGVVGNPAPGLLDHLIVGKPGLSISNASPGATLYLAGRDAETDDAYLKRCMGKWGIPSAGTQFEERIKSAPIYDFLIPTSAPTVTRWLVRDDNPYGPGTIGVCLANAAGPATAGEVAAVAAAVIPIKPVGSQKTKVFAATQQTQAVIARLYGDGSRDADLEADAIIAIEKLSATYPIGSLATKFIFRAKIIQLLEQIPGMKNVLLDKPEFDTPLAPYNVVQLVPSLTVIPAQGGG